MAEKYDMSLLSDLFGKGLLRQAIMGSAQDEASAIMAEANASTRKEIEAAQAKAAEYKKQILEAEERRAVQERTVIVSAAEMKAQKLLLNHRDDLISRAFLKIREEIEANKKRLPYREVLTRLAREAAAQLPGREFALRLSARDRQEFGDGLLAELNKSGGGATFKFTPEAANIMGGVLVEAENGRVVYDNSFDNLLERKRPELRLMVAQILFEQKAA